MLLLKYTEPQNQTAKEDNVNKDIDEHAHENGAVTFLLSEDGKALWVAEVIPAVGGQFDGGWIATDHPPIPVSGRRSGFYFTNHGQAMGKARQLIEAHAGA